jgi:hypothetical protein
MSGIRISHLFPSLLLLTSIYNYLSCDKKQRKIYALRFSRGDDNFNGHSAKNILLQSKRSEIMKHFLLPVVLAHPSSSSFTKQQDSLTLKSKVACIVGSGDKGNEINCKKRIRLQGHLSLFCS